MQRVHCQSSSFFRFVAGIFAGCFVITTVAPQVAYAQALTLPGPQALLQESSSYAPAVMRGLTLDANDPLHFRFWIDTGLSNLKGPALEKESTRLIKYFMAGLTTPEKDLWVNLSPYEKERIVPDGFGVTEMGRDLLAQDYILKQLTSSLMYPEQALGKKFWERVHEKAKAQFGSSEVPLNTFNKVWIVPHKAELREHSGQVVILNAHLKVMLEEDYLALTKNEPSGSTEVKAISGVTSAAVREILIPELEREVNEGQNFSVLRQIYYSMILAVWYKHNLRESLLGKVYVDRNKTSGIEIVDKNEKLKIYDRYVEAFRKGAFNYIKEETDPSTGETVPRKYISGGWGALDEKDWEQVIGVHRGPLDMAAMEQWRPPVVGIDASMVEVGQPGIPAVQTVRESSFFVRAMALLLISAIFLTNSISGNAFSVDAAKKLAFEFARTIASLQDPKTRLVPSHYDHPGFEKLGFAYDLSVAAMLADAAKKSALSAETKAPENPFLANGDHPAESGVSLAGGEPILDYFADRLIAAVGKEALADNNGVYGAVRYYDHKPSLVNGVDITVADQKGAGQLEYWTTPGPIAWMLMAFLHVNPKKYERAAVLLGEVLLSMQRADGGVVDGNRGPRNVNTEPHMDAFAAFIQLYQITGDQRWQQAANKAYEWFAKNVYYPDQGVIYQGIWESGPSKIFAVDAYSWTMAGPAGDRLDDKALALLTHTMLSHGLAKVTLDLPDGRKVTLVLSDFTDSIDPNVKEARGGFHPMGSLEWTGGVIMALQKDAARLWNSGDTRIRDTAKMYKAVAEILSQNAAEGFYHIDKGLMGFYASGQGVETGHGWKTPYFFVKKPGGQVVVKGGSIISGWPIFAWLGYNPLHVLGSESVHVDVYNGIPLDDNVRQAAASYIGRIVALRSFVETIPELAPEARDAIVEPGRFNAQMWLAFEQGNYEEAIRWAKKVVNNQDWRRLAIYDQKMKTERYGGLIRYPWGVSSAMRQAEQQAIWRYPLLNEYAASVWAMAASNYELSKRDPSKRQDVKMWMKEMLLNFRFHQIAAEVDQNGNAHGYWNAITSWLDNPGNRDRDRQMGLIFAEVLAELGMSRSNVFPPIKSLPEDTAVDKPAPLDQTEINALPGSRNLLRLSVGNTYADSQWQAAATYFDFSEPLSLKSGQKIVVHYSLTAAQTLGVQLIGTSEPETQRGDMRLYYDVGGRDKTLTIQVMSPKTIRRISFQHGKNAWGALPGGAYPSSMTVQSMELIDKAQNDKSVDKAADVGGINLDPAMLDMQIRRDDHGIPLPWARQDPVMLTRIQGFRLCINSITTYSNLLTAMPPDIPTPNKR